IVGGVRERWVATRRGRGKTVCARGARRALLRGPSTSPLEDAARILRKGEIRIRRAKAKTLRLTLPFVRARAAREASRQGRRRWLRFVAAVPPLGDGGSLRRPVSVCAEDSARAQ